MSKFDILGNATVLIKSIEAFLTSHEIWIKLLTLIVAVSIGCLQIIINNQLKELQYSVAITAIPGPEGKIKLLNTGKINLYLFGFDVPGNMQHFNKPRLIPAGTGDAAYYWIDPPDPSYLTEGKEYEFKIYLEDELGRKWISQYGGIVIHLKRKEDNSDKNAISVWSYKIKRENWNLK